MGIPVGMFKGMMMGSKNFVNKVLGIIDKPFLFSCLILDSHILTVGETESNSCC